jgi:hypothetical protein
MAIEQGLRTDPEAIMLAETVSVALLNFKSDTLLENEQKEELDGSNFWRSLMNGALMRGSRCCFAVAALGFLVGKSAGCRRTVNTLTPAVVHCEGPLLSSGGLQK